MSAAPSTTFAPLLWQNVNLDDPRQIREFMRQLIPYLAWLQKTLVTLLNAPPSSGGGGGTGDMTKAIYDVDNNGRVDSCDSLPWGRLTGVPATFAPSAHAPTHNLGGSDPVSPDWTQVQNKPASFTPAAHASTHLDNGTDPIPVATALRTGSAPKLSGTATTFLNGTGAYSTPTGVTPAAHASTHLSAGSDPIALATSVLAGLCPAVDNTTIQVVASKLSCVALAYSNLTGVPSSFTPSAHKTTHQSGGSDSIPLDTLATPTDVTTLNASTSAHGLLRKLNGSAASYMDGTGNWSAPPGGGITDAPSDGNAYVRKNGAWSATEITTLQSNVSTLQSQVATLQGYYEWTYPGGSP